MPSILSVTEYVPKQDRNGLQQPRCCTNLYVKNFPAGNFTDEDLEAIFVNFGEIVSAVVMKDEN
jgi:RNA recognition motif-containing protein